MKVDVKEDLRRYINPHRDTRRWKELYNERTSVERCNSRLKTYLTADDLHELSVLLARYAQEREEREHFGDYVIRTGMIKAVTDGTDFHN